LWTNVQLQATIVQYYTGALQSHLRTSDERILTKVLRSLSDVVQFCRSSRNVRLRKGWRLRREKKRSKRKQGDYCLLMTTTTLRFTVA